MAPKNNPAYRPDIDGLRAIAVTSVVGYHAFPEWMKGGYVGVDIFFVISGFLITSIILKSSANNGFSVLDFYSRRIRRIFPALIAMFSACLLAGWLLLFPDEFQQLGKHTLGAVFFVSNFVFWSEAGYFDIASELKPLLHLWSLSIEEQFYTLWPLTLLFFVKGKRPILCTLLLTAVSFLWCVFGELDKVANFYTPFTRIWELLCGGLLAFIPFHPQLAARFLPRHASWQAALAEAASLLGMALLVLSIFFVLDSKTVFPGWASLLPALGAVLIIATGPTTVVNRYLLGNPLFVFIGLISYPLYLWHWPFLSFPKITNGASLTHDMRIYAVMGALVFAVLTYYFIEKPLRHGSHRVSIGLLVVALLIGTLGYLGKEGILQARQADTLFQKIAIAKSGSRADMVSQATYIMMDHHEYRIIGSGPKTTLYIGDSNMDQYWMGVEVVIATKQGTRKAMSSGCRIPIPHVTQPGDTLDCNEVNTRLYALAAHDPDIDTVVIAAQWRGAPYFQYTEGSQVYPMTTPEGMTKAMDQLVTSIQALTTQGKTVFLLLNIPGGPEFEPHNLIQRSLLGFHMAMPHLEGGITLEQHQQRTQSISPFLIEAAQRSGAIILDPADVLCRDNFCSAVSANGDPIYRDMDHLGWAYSYDNPAFIGQTLP